VVQQDIRPVVNVCTVAGDTWLNTGYRDGVCFGVSRMYTGRLLEIPHWFLAYKEQGLTDSTGCMTAVW